MATGIEYYQFVQIVTFIVNLTALILLIYWGYKNKEKRLLSVLPGAYQAHLLIYYIWVAFNQESVIPTLGTVWSSLLRFQSSFVIVFLMIYFFFLSKEGAKSK